jgi:hypothetical protein
MPSDTNPAPAGRNALCVREPIVLVVSPSREPDGLKASSSRGQLFDSAIDGLTIVKRSTQPFLDACRVLVGQAVQPTTRILMRHAGPTADALCSTVGAAAKFTVREKTADGKPRFVRWSRTDFMGMPMSASGRPCVPASRPVSETRGAAERAQGLDPAINAKPEHAVGRVRDDEHGTDARSLRPISRTGMWRMR